MLQRDCLRGLLVVSLVAGFANTAMARRNNPPPNVSGSIASNGNSCTNCHSAATGGLGSVQILGAPAAYQLNQLYNLTVRISDPVQVGAGFQLSVEDAIGQHVGTLIVSDAVNTQLNGTDPQFINHTGTGVGNSVMNWAGSADYNVQWQSAATDVGPVTFYAAGNAINDSFTLFGDKVYTTSVTANAAPPVPALSSAGVLLLSLTQVAMGAALLIRRRAAQLRSTVRKPNNRD